MIERTVDGTTANAAEPGGVSPGGSGSHQPVGEIDRGVVAWGKYVGSMVVLATISLLVRGDEYWLSLATLGLLFAGLASAWNIIGGFAGQFSLAHGVFFAAGAYSVALLQVRLAWSPWAALVVGVALAAALAAALSWPFFRLRGPFFAIGTLALNEVVLALVGYFEWTGGSAGIQIPFSESAVTDRGAWAWTMLVYLAVVVGISLLIIRSRLGYYLIAVRDEEDAAAASGASPLTVKSLGFTISAALTGLGGGLYVMYIGFVDPSSVLSVSDVGIMFPLFALLGGIGTIAGPVVGGLLLDPGEALLRGGLASLPPGTSVIVLGALLIVSARYFKQGIWGALLQLTRRFRGQH